ncbi:MAG: mandelate racemase/muconate lactonizing enzyme family protein [Acidimicrobiales bacterium]
MELTLHREVVTLRDQVRAAHQHHVTRTRLFVRLEHDGVVGYGEIAPQPVALNGDPGVGEVIQELDGYVLSQLQSALEREGRLPSWTRMTRFAGSRPSSPPAVAVVEMALLDRELRSEGRSIYDLWPEHFNTPLQGTVSLLDDDAWNISAEWVRLRVKTAPGSLSVGARERLAALSVPVLVDFNCSASTVEEVVAHVQSIREYATVSAVEQPFAPGNVIDHANLAARIDIPVSLDEGVRSQRDLEQIIRYDAAKMVCIKPARVGGYANARTMIELARGKGLRPYVGGFFESPFARHVNGVLSRHLVNEPSDIDIVASHLLDEVESSEGGFGLIPSPSTLERAVVVASFA